MAKLWLANTLPAPATWGQHSVEDASAMPVVIHAEFEEVPQKTAGLRNPEGECML